MQSKQMKTLLVGGALALLAGCMSSEPKATDESAAGEQVKQVSATLAKPYLLNEAGEIIHELPPEVLAAIKEDQRSQAHLSAIADLDSLFDPLTGKLRDGGKLAEIQNDVDIRAKALAKGAAK